MTYAVTFCTIDSRADANPMWHACILLSKMNEVAKKLEVIDTWSFYGLPSTDDPNSITKKLKVALKIDVNLRGNHGKWRHEETRFLDKGVGLHGRTFEVTEEQFNALANHMQILSNHENAAIAEAADFLRLTAKKNPRIYDYEDYSELIFHIEKVKARQEGREARLKPFELNIGFALGGPFVRNSHTCKSHAISALSTVLTKEQIAELTVGGKHPTVPRFSGLSEEFYLYSTGSLSTHKKKSGDIVQFREHIGQNNVQLFWALPPQQFDALSSDTTNLWSLDKGHASKAKKLVSQLIQLEWLLLNAPVAAPYKAGKELLLNEVAQYYKGFATIQPKAARKEVNPLLGLVYSVLLSDQDSQPASFNTLECAKLFLRALGSTIAHGWCRPSDVPVPNSPRSPAPQNNEKTLSHRIDDTESFLNALYAALVDGWQMEEAAAPELSQPDAPISADYGVLSYLTVKDKKAICNVLGRSYLTPLALEELSEEEELIIPSVAAM